MIDMLGYFGSGVVAAYVAGVAAPTANSLAVGYVLARAVYCFIYVRLQDDRRFARARSISWGICLALATSLWVSAGMKAQAT